MRYKNKNENETKQYYQNETLLKEIAFVHTL